MPPPLQILSSFIDTLLKSDDPKSKLVLSIAPASFKVLFDPQDLTYKAENWVDVWANMLKLLSRDSLQGYEVQLSNLVDLVTAGIQRSQASSTNPKKVSWDLLPQPLTYRMPKPRQTCLRTTARHISFIRPFVQGSTMVLLPCSFTLPRFRRRNHLVPCLRP